MFDIIVTLFILSALFLLICSFSRPFVECAGDDEGARNSENGEATSDPAVVEQTITMTQTQLQELIDAKIQVLRDSLSASVSSGDVKSGNFKPVALQSSNFVAHVAFKAPQPLYNQNPVVWFEILEQQFIVANIKLEGTRYSHAVSALDSRLHNTFADLITRDKGDEPYSTFKQEVIRVLGESEKTKLHNIMHGLTLSDMKPSQLLAKFKLNAGTLFSETAVRQMWLSRLPQQVQMVLTLFANDVALAVLAERADNVFETMKQTHVNVVEQATSKEMLASHELEDKFEKFRVQMLSEISALIKGEQGARSRDRSRFNSHTGRDNSFRSPSRNRTINHNNECFYHGRFGEKSLHCAVGCKHYAKFTGATVYPIENTKN